MAPSNRNGGSPGAQKANGLLPTKLWEATPRWFMSGAFCTMTTPSIPALKTGFRTAPTTCGFGNATSPIPDSPAISAASEAACWPT